MAHLARFTLSPVLLREHLAELGVALTEAVLPIAQLGGNPPAVAVPITGPTDLRPGDPLTGQAPILVSQDFQPIDQASARQLESLGVHNGQITCLLVHLPAKQAIALLSQMQERHELDEQLEAGINPVTPQLNFPAEQLAAAPELVSSPQSVTLFGRMEAEEGARKGELFSTNQLGFHRYQFIVDFDNLLLVPAEAINSELSPAANMYEIWNKGVDAARAALNVSLNREDYLRQAVQRQARQKGYDGIQYGTDWVQLIP